MQVKIGVHESIVDRIKPGLRARIKLPDKTLEGEVISVASVTRPAGWWTGNVVKYDTIIKLPQVPGLRPGMSAEVEVVIAEYEDVVSVPVAAVVETDNGTFCWIKTPTGPERRVIKLGDTNSVHVIVKAGLKPGDEIVLNPVALIEEAQEDVLQPGDNSLEGPQAPGTSGKSAERPAAKPKPSP